MEAPAQLATQQITTSCIPLAAPPTYASHLLHAFTRVPLAQHLISQLNAGHVPTNTSFKEMFANNPVT